MGQYAALAIEMQEDRSFPSPTWQYRQRIEDLQNRLEGLPFEEDNDLKRKYDDRVYTEEDILCAPVEFLFCDKYIAFALETAKQKLALLETQNQEDCISTPAQMEPPFPQAA